jgi:hypothetical protein
LGKSVLDGEMSLQNTQSSGIKRGQVATDSGESDTGSGGLDMLAPLGQYMLNESSINQMPLTQKTDMYDPIYRDTSRRDGLQQNQIGATARQGFRAINAGGTQARNASIGDIVSRSMDASNQVADRENARIDEVEGENNQLANRAGMYNTEATNRAYGDYQHNRMMQLGEKMKNRNNLTQSILGNLQIRKMNDLDRDKMKLISERDKERGIIDRSDIFKEIFAKHTKG